MTGLISDAAVQCHFDYQYPPIMILDTGMCLVDTEIYSGFRLIK